METSYKELKDAVTAKGFVPYGLVNMPDENGLYHVLGGRRNPVSGEFEMSRFYDVSTNLTEEEASKISLREIQVKEVPVRDGE